MKYYRIWHSLNEKEIGKYCQIKEGVYKFNINDDRFIGKVDYFLKPIPFSPLVPELTLWPKAKVTDLISVSTIGLHDGLIISDKIKEILEKNKVHNIQFFKLAIYQKYFQVGVYWYMRYCGTSNQLIDYSNSEIWEVEYSLNKVKEKYIVDYDDFVVKQKELSYPRSLLIFSIVIDKKADQSTFVLGNIDGGLGFFISEELKHKLEQACCTGIIFAEPNEKYP